MLSFLLIYGIFSLIVPKIKWRNQIRTYLIAIALTLGGLLASYKYVNYTRMKDVESEIANENSSAGSRLAMWKSSWDIIKERPIIGYSAGDSKDVLQAKFRDERLAYAVVKNLNVHDEYIQVTVSYGILGLLALLLPMIVPLKYVFKGTNYLFLLFIVNVGFNFLTESVLETQAGNVFYGVMWSLLYFTWKE